MNHIATIAAHPIKADLGGGFRGVFFVRATKDRRSSERFDTLEQARHWAKLQAHEAYEAVGYRIAAVRKPGEYQANVWVA